MCKEQHVHNERVWNIKFGLVHYSFNVNNSHKFLFLMRSQNALISCNCRSQIKQASFHSLKRSSCFIEALGCECYRR